MYLARPLFSCPWLGTVGSMSTEAKSWLASDADPSLPRGMEPIVELKAVTHAYLRDDAPEYKDELKPEHFITPFEDLSLSVPPGMTAITGENGVGKTTVLLLAAARLAPARGSVTILGQDAAQLLDAASEPAGEEARNKLVSMVYQNMEFESEESIGNLLQTVYKNGYHQDKELNFVGQLIYRFDLGDELKKKTQQLSKGAMQRFILALSLCYGSSIIVMDEPVFALEEPRKDKTLEFLHQYSRTYGAHIVYTAHNLDLCEKYSDTMVLMKKKGGFVMGSVDQVATKEMYEDAYGVPQEYLHQRQQFQRASLERS